jgi:hypothetical protein
MAYVISFLAKLTLISHHMLPCFLPQEKRMVVGVF